VPARVIARCDGDGDGDGDGSDDGGGPVRRGFSRCEHGRSAVKIGARSPLVAGAGVAS